MEKLVAFFEIPAVDFDLAVAFYENLFECGLTVSDCAGEKMAFFPAVNGACPGAISKAPGFIPSPDGVLISLHVDDMDAAIGRITAGGGWIVRGRTRIISESGGYFCLFNDPEGNRVGLYSVR